MKMLNLIVAFSLAGALNINAENNKSLNGTWCVGEEGFVLKFSGKDSLLVNSNNDESIKAEGNYKKTDTSFTATLVNGDVTMKMKYQYRWCSSDTIKAKAEQFTINDEPVNSPEEWMFMVKCADASKNDVIIAKEAVKASNRNKN
ncbi:MAG TPA: hypothetical protein VHP36_00340 [Chitinispirillaceae bacterium]|nr:hypothetical protein [Chitinispirillaceae bacterium]